MLSALATSTGILFLTGAATSLVGSLLGLGGGVLLVPLLTLALRVPFRTAVAASLLSVIASASGSATVNLRRGLVNMRLGLALEVATSIGGIGGALTTTLLSERQLYLVFAAVMAVMGVAMVLRSQVRNVIGDLGIDRGRLGGTLQEGEVSYAYRVRRLPLGLLASLAAGAISGLLGVGGGIVKVPVLNAFCGVPIRVAAATSTFMIGVTAAASAFLYFARGDVALPLAAAICLGALPGSLLGARLSNQIGTRSLKIFMAMVLASVALQMAVRAL
jgi:uncharacterized membrane protein YfcA